MSYIKQQVYTFQFKIGDPFAFENHIISFYSQRFFLLFSKTENVLDPHYTSLKFVKDSCKIVRVVYNPTATLV